MYGFTQVNLVCSMVRTQDGDRKRYALRKIVYLGAVLVVVVIGKVLVGAVRDLCDVVI